jgi:lytic murein transglycosylase
MGSRWRLMVGAAAAFVLSFAAWGALAQGQSGFRAFIETLWPEAEANGVSRGTFDAAFAGIKLDLTAPDLVLPGKAPSEVKGQAEFTRTPAQYLNVTYLKRLAVQGRALLGKHRQVLESIERQLGVPGPVVLAIWGRETAFGAPNHSPHYVIEALATQAFLGRRKELFRSELIAALKLLEDGVRTRQTLNGSWAGAMGLTQFMPSEYYTLAYDLDGDGRKDIWGSVPDALASAANQLRAKGWEAGLPWGFEVRLPSSVTCGFEGPDKAQTVRQWAKLGVVRARDLPFPDNVLDAQAFILMPGGAYGPAFLALENFMVIKRYNMSDLYALFVGDLSDRIAGGGSFETPWGEVRQLSARGIEELQTRLQAEGYSVAKIDGKAGMNTRAMVGAYQKANGLKVDCWPSEPLLTHIRKAEGGKGSTRRPEK